MACLQLGGASIRKIGLIPELGLELSSFLSHLRTPSCKCVAVWSWTVVRVGVLTTLSYPPYIASCSVAYYGVLRNAATGLVPKSEPTRPVGDLILPKSHLYSSLNPTPHYFLCSLVPDLQPDILLSCENNPKHHTEHYPEQSAERYPEHRPVNSLHEQMYPALLLASFSCIYI